jgi:predicted dinucleotide-binding enzyme
VKISSRSAEKLQPWIKETSGKGGSGTFEEAATFGDIVVLAVLGEVAESAINIAGPKNCSGKLVIDVTNPLDFSKGMPPSMLDSFKERSIGEMVQEKLPDSWVVKCFNTVPNSQFFRPKHSEAQMLICGNEKNAKEQTTAILKQFGWAGSLDVGGIESARYLEWLVPLWVRAAMAAQSWDSMFMLAK